MEQTEKFALTANQQQVFEAVETTVYNYLIQGKPGVGKSVLINALLNDGKKRYTASAPTGLAALNIGGRTLHSIFRIPVSSGIIHPTFNNFSDDTRVINFIKYGPRALIIDEISMVRADMFDYIDRFIRFVKGNDLPFGGVQIVAVGDFYQLPPVVISTEKKQLEEAGYDSPFVFSSHVFKQGSFKVLSLHEVLRQKGDTAFLELLDSARIGRVTPKQSALLNKNVAKGKDLVIKLCATNGESFKINKWELSKLEPEQHTFEAKDYGYWPAYPVEKTLDLKVGAQILVKKNKADRPPDNFDSEFQSVIVNGTLGVVTAINEEEADPYVEIQTAKGTKHKIWIARWERKEKVFEDGVWEERVLATFEQFPIALAWAISIHKSQGQTFDVVHIEPNRIFAAGQLYVAISRCKKLSGITFGTPVNTRKFWADRNVIKFFETLNEEVDATT